MPFITVDDAITQDPSRRDVDRRRRRGPRERGRPHDGRRARHARGDQLHDPARARARLRARRRPSGSTSSTSSRWSRRTRPRTRRRSPCRRPPYGHDGHLGPRAVDHDPEDSSTPRRDRRDFIRPGHVFPLRAKEGGVLRRAGHTEAAVDLARMAGLPPVARDLRGARTRTGRRRVSRSSRRSRPSTASRSCRSRRSSSTVVGRRSSCGGRPRR